ncbi:MAG: hypothetical protein ACD_16C00053G0002 [uncultured bacterium]|nr:MAG: hypothetical protein ACD_16C00053G0002 [uncultured bacterium]OFW67904.1 MAG: phenylalanine--tRNA ligase subunit beta [Alphaproteobacteria bacterium GWC2_42_16]OFW73739.1 MAG: phenylalanine--tRNA ligase subunit beta [Alphaproteobacteria bacterium GWA2_41_27]OFW82149.1 MAG: phenylalanine--tRNA ligase subunit beta [Alphaproteobacteria bacterium RIFCSPHIGHO2_12_FULL_42_100]OFW85194.1 MAG: phenylalanine--tRNA ligase subunit beta [Alphaproteobacteria bacterium RBG_16_42_14]OFW91332.1 MAG: ph
MRFTLSWLKEHLETSATLDEISEKLTNIGLLVDKIKNLGEVLTPFTICEIIEAKKHPNADRLQVCQVQTGEELIQVVCGAKNARKGLKAVLARPGQIIPSTQQVLKVGKVRDVESYGMMCSGEELLLEETSEGIIEVDSKAPVGQSYAQWLGLDDPLIEIEVTPNRGDCLGIHGVARDLAASGIGKLKPLKTEKVPGTFPCPLPLSVDLEACPHFTGRVIQGVKNGPSPKWLQEKLRSIGLRPISALVDITNFFIYDRCRPLHVFDADKIKGKLMVRTSKEGETFKALDGKTYTLSEDMTVITDDSGIISLAGIMGGESTACDDTTKNVFLEAAFFDPIRTSITGRVLNIFSDSRHRFERWVDPLSTLPGLEAATKMILDLCGGTASKIVEEGTPPFEEIEVPFLSPHLESLGGLYVDSLEVEKIFTALGFKLLEADNGYGLIPPSWRSDIAQEADLIEEVLRMVGYNKIPSVPYGERPEKKPLDSRQERRFAIRDCLAGQGLIETITWSFMSEREASLFGGIPETLLLNNPISQELNGMRPSLLPNLLKAALQNQNRAHETITLFEVGPQYFNTTPDGQDLVAAGLRAGFFEKSWCEMKRPVDIYDAKADAFALFDLIHLCPQVDPKGPNWYHPGRSATLKFGPQVMGYFGELHPRVLKAFDLKGPVVAFEIFIDRLPFLKKKTTAKPKLELSPYQPVDRDFAFVVGASVSAESLIKAVFKADTSLLYSLTIFDVFEMEHEKKSIALRVRFQSKDRTLTEKEIQAISDKIISSVAKEVGGVLRQ